MEDISVRHNLSKRLNSILSDINRKKENSLFQHPYHYSIDIQSWSRDICMRTPHSHERIKFTKGLNSKIQIPCSSENLGPVNGSVSRDSKWSGLCLARMRLVGCNIASYLWREGSNVREGSRAV